MLGLFLGILIPVGLAIVVLFILIITNGLRIRLERRESDNYVPSESIFANIR